MAELSTLARPYAKAVFELARDGGNFADWSAQLATLAEITANADVRRALTQPGVARSRLAEAVIAAGKSFDAKAKALVQLLASNGRLAAAPAIAAQFERLRAEAESRAAVEITTAATVGEAEKAKLATAVGKRLNRAVDIVWNIDESLIAGARIRAGDLVIDGSAQGELERLKAALSQ
jgi:F-type H+-transporting ATPase subunit delta